MVTALLLVCNPKCNLVKQGDGKCNARSGTAVANLLLWSMLPREDGNVCLAAWHWNDHLMALNCLNNEQIYIFFFQKSNCMIFTLLSVSKADCSSNKSRFIFQQLILTFFLSQIYFLDCCYLLKQ